MANTTAAKARAGEKTNSEVAARKPNQRWTFFSATLSELALSGWQAVSWSIDRAWRVDPEVLLDGRRVSDCVSRAALASSMGYLWWDSGGTHQSGEQQDRC